MNRVKFLENAPVVLIQSLEGLRSAASILTSSNQNKVIDIMLNHSTNIELCSEEQKQELCARYHDIFLLFPLNEQIEVLEKLLTEPDAEKIWRSLSKKIRKDHEYVQFWHTCIDAKGGGLKVYKRTKAQHKKHFQKIEKSAIQLSKLLEETDEMIYYPVSKLISTSRIEGLRANLKTDKSEQHIRSYLNKTIPDIQAILNNIALKAEAISNTDPLVKKPNSKNSDTTKNSIIPHFVRYLSCYFKDKYGQPLHEFVATTARIVFNDLTIDADYVRKIVKN